MNENQNHGPATTSPADRPASVVELQALVLEQQQRIEQQSLFIDQHLNLVPPQSALGKALQYANKQWDKLTVYVADGRLRMDNNLTENAIRPFVIGRKNYLFCDTVAGTNVSANLYSLIETAKANKLEPYAYLRTVFTELPQATSVEAIEQLLPIPTNNEDLADVSRRTAKRRKTCQ